MISNDGDKVDVTCPFPWSGFQSDRTMDDAYFERLAERRSR